MQGLLDILDASGVLRSPQWKTRFFKLDPGLQTLEYFRDATLVQRKGKIQLSHATVATADELGQLLTNTKSGSSPFPIEYARRFVFRITEENTRKHVFLCAEITEQEDDHDSSNASAAARHQASREYLHQWVQAIQQTISNGQIPAVGGGGGLRDLRTIHHQMEQYVDTLHLSAAVVRGRLQPDGTPVYDFTPVAWTLTREIADPTVPGMWQIAEYSCSWQVSRTVKQLHDFDSQLRVRFHDAMDHDVGAFPKALAHNLLTRLSDTQLAKNAQVLDQYFQKVLSFHGITSAGSDGSAMLDYFLESAPNLSQLRKQLTLVLTTKKIVNWTERQRFVSLQEAHRQELLQAQRNDQESHRRQRKESQQDHLQDHQHQHHHHHHHQHHEQDDDDMHDELEDAQELQIPTSPVEVVPGIDSVHERIARIGHKLLIEAFASET